MIMDIHTSNPTTHNIHAHVHVLVLFDNAKQLNGLTINGK